MRKGWLLILIFLGSLTVNAQINCAKFSADYGKSIALFDSTDYVNSVKSFTKLINATSLAKCFNKAYYYRGSSYFYLGRVDSAITDFEIYTKLEPEDELGLRKMGALYYYIGNNELALVYYKAALDLAPEDVYTLYNMGEAYFHSGNLEIYPDSEEGLVGRATILIELGQFELAKTDLDDCLSLDKNNTDAWFYRGYCNNKLEKYDEAVSDFSSILTIDKENFEGYYNRGISYYSLERYEEAVKDYTKAVALNSEDPDVYFNRGMAYDLQQKYQFAIDDYTKAIFYNSADQEAYFNRCVSKFMLGKKKDACEDCRMAEFMGKKDISPKLLKACKAKKTKEKLK
jgi:tetratricopeptide (TPR) repeat protein